MIIKMDTFRKFSLDHEDFISVSHLCHFIMILSNHNEIPRIYFGRGGEYLPPFHEIFVLKIPIQLENVFMKHYAPNR